MKGILERDYLHCKDGRWYRLEVTRREKYEEGSQDCGDCAFFGHDSHGPSCAIELDGFLTCCDVGEGYNAVWVACQLPLESWLTSGQICDLLDRFVTSEDKTISPHGIGLSFARRLDAIRHRKAKDGRSWEYLLKDAMDVLWDNGYFEEFVKDLNTPYRTDRRK